MAYYNLCKQQFTCNKTKDKLPNVAFKTCLMCGKNMLIECATDKDFYYDKRRWKSEQIYKK